MPGESPELRRWQNDNYSLPHETKDVYEICEIYDRHAKASEAASNLENTQIFRYGEQKISTWWSHQEN